MPNCKTCFQQKWQEKEGSKDWLVKVREAETMDFAKFDVSGLI